VKHKRGTIQFKDRFEDIIISGDESVFSVEAGDALTKYPATTFAAVVAKRRGSAVLCGVICRFTLPDLAELRALWLSTAGRDCVPSRRVSAWARTAPFASGISNRQ